MMHLSRDLLFDIFCRLPIRSLFLCKCVCRTWRSLLQDPSFREMHFEQSKQSTDHCIKSIIFFTQGEENSSSPRGLSLLDLEADIDHSNSQMAAATPSKVGLNFRCYRLSTSISSCNGMLCFAEIGLNYPAFVCNPVTGEFLLLPRSPSPFWVHCRLVYFGMGFDAETRVYKVVKLVYRKDSRYASRTELEIYTLRGVGFWRPAGEVPWRIKDRRCVAGISVGGAIHWWKRHDHRTIISMDVGHEEFYTNELPEMGSRAHEMIEWKGCLGIIEYLGGGACTNIWVFKDNLEGNGIGRKGSWTKDLSIVWNISPELREFIIWNLPLRARDRIKARLQHHRRPFEYDGRPSKHPLCRPIGIRQNGEILLLCESCILGLYNLENGRFRLVEVDLPFRMSEDYQWVSQVVSIGPLWRRY